MKSNFNTFGVIFFIKKYKAKNGRAPIYARITVDGRRADFSVRKSIEPRFWNGMKGLAKGSNPETIKFNQFIESIRSKIVTLYQDTIIRNETPTAEDLKNKFLGIEKIEHSLSSIFTYHREMLIPSPHKR
ncbi:hypothetical protein IFO69_10065 [Echinicola sp. CAU 1574]|uniref:Arm DNA-binding domain-containing protein n=1 Tax=Echinicola arenosa TaxID=2774144 RepID=A0ABR9AK06_9BACT|nr:Arm DNA-binding domain-containing protein [Echinicola arenosa]MBD8489091.1 hypothetical protein [Echinicola arenosa]